MAGSGGEGALREWNAICVRARCVSQRTHAPGLSGAAAAQRCTHVAEKGVGARHAGEEVAVQGGHASVRGLGQRVLQRGVHVVHLAQQRGPNLRLAKHQRHLALRHAIPVSDLPRCVSAQRRTRMNASLESCTSRVPTASASLSPRGNASASPRRTLGTGQKRRIRAAVQHKPSWLAARATRYGRRRVLRCEPLAGAATVPPNSMLAWRTRQRVWSRAPATAGPAPAAPRVACGRAAACGSCQSAPRWGKMSALIGAFASAAPQEEVRRRWAHSTRVRRSGAAFLHSAFSL